MVQLALLPLVAAAALATASPTQPRRDLVEHERAAALPDAWRHVGPVAPDHTLSLRIAVKEHRSVDAAEILSRSDRRSPNYGRFLGPSELKALLASSTEQAARDASWETVRRWIADNNVETARETAGGFDVRLSARQAEDLLGARFSLYARDDEAAVPRTEAYSLPSDLWGHVDYVFPTVHFFGSAPRRGASSSSSSSAHAAGLERRQRGIPTPPFDCTKYYCPSNLTEMYNIDYLPDVASGSKLGIAGFLEQYTSHADWETFISQHGLANASVQADYSVVTVNGGKSPDTVDASGIEAMLDLEYTSSFTGPLNVTYFSVGGRPPTLEQPGNVSVPANESANEPYLEFLDYLLDSDDVPQVISISYTDDEQSVPYSYAAKVCDRFSYLALRGVSVLVASGDAGAQGTRFSDCLGPDREPRFIPTFPASCPWVTTIGATAAWGGAAGFSSGGFSNYFARPGWQDAASRDYVEKLDEAAAAEPPYYAFNTSGRGYPDLTLLGTDYLVTNANYTLTAKGTSASTPVIAAMVALINDIRLKAGKPVLGFLNPLLYDAATAEGITDVTEGQINGCSVADHQQPGFEAAVGWDAASGLGAPDFAKLRKILTSA